MLLNQNTTQDSILKVTPELLAELHRLTVLYHEHGFPIVPLIGKRPIQKNWTKWCEVLPDHPLIHPKQTGIGLCLGPASGVVAVDIDTDDPAILSKVPYSPIVRRGKKGEVRFFRYTPEIVSRTFQSLKIEILSVGRQVVLPPSLHPETLRSYVWGNK